MPSLPWHVNIPAGVTTHANEEAFRGPWRQRGTGLLWVGHYCGRYPPNSRMASTRSSHTSAALCPAQALGLDVGWVCPKLFVDLLRPLLLLGLGRGWGSARGWSWVGCRLYDPRPQQSASASTSTPTGVSWPRQMNVHRESLACAWRFGH